MISRSGKENFFAAHYDWLLTGAGLVALLAAGGFYGLSLGDDPDELAADKASQVDRMKPSDIGVKPLDMTTNAAALRVTRSPVTINDVPEKQASFLASARYVTCKKCNEAISGDVKAVPNCPFCGEKQEEPAAIVLDADGDGLPDEWEKKFGFKPSDASDGTLDKDGDGFTNLEEYQAKTNPNDKNDHPDYLDSLKIQLPLKETYMPFVFTKATQIPGGWRCEFFDAKKKDANNTGLITAKVGEPVGNYGYIVKEYRQKSEKREKKGMKGMMFSVDVSEVVLTRKTDGKPVTIVIGSPKTAKPVPVDVQASLVYERGTVQNMDVVTGQEIELNGTKYKIVDIKSVGKGAKIVIANALTGVKRTIQALEQ